MGGVFLVLIAGCGVAFLLAVLEFFWNVRKVAVQEKVSLISIKLIFQFICYINF